MLKKIASVLFVLVVVTAVTYPFLSDFFSPKASNDEILNGLLAGNDPGVPVINDQNLILDHSRISNYEVISVFNLAADKADPKSYQEQAFKDYYNLICKNQSYANILDRGIHFGYIHLNTQGKQIFYLNIRKETCADKMQWGKIFDV